jgi:hypothetical protein
MESDTVTATSVTPVTTSGMIFAVTSGNTYRFKFQVLHIIGNNASNTTCGLRLGLTFPAATVIGTHIRIPQAAAGTDMFYEARITASGTSVTAASTQYATQNVMATVEGIIIPSADGNLALLHGAEISTSFGVVIKAGTNGILERLN